MRILAAAIGALLASVEPPAAPSAAPAEAPPGAAPAAPPAEAAGSAEPTPLAAPPAAPPAAAPAGTLTRAPELIEFVPAEYPPDAEEKGIQGSVLLSIVIGEDGEVRQAVVVDPGPHPGFAPAALHAVAQFRFRPAEIDGVPAPVEISYRYDFVLKRVEPPPASEAPVVLDGRILERGTRSPIAGATVEAQGAVSETGPDGRFALRGVEPGDVLVRVVSPEHEPFALTERIEQGKKREVEYRLTRRHYDPYEAVVRGARERREISVQTLTTEEVRTVAGTQGDTLKVIQNLPGVARSPFGIGLLVVRGSEPTETTVYLDGVPVPLLFHFGGITSVVNADVIEALDFQPGNFGVAHGRALGGNVELRTKEGRREWHGAAQMDVFDGRVEVEGPVGDGSAFASVRRSWVDAVLAVALPRVAPDTASDLRVAPRYYDYQTKLTLPALGGQVSVFAFGSDDRMEFIRKSEHSGRPTFYLATLFHRVGASWRRPAGPLTNDLVLAVGKDTFDVLQSSNFGILTDVWGLTLRDTLSWRLSDRLTLDLGVDALLRHFDYSVYAPPVESPGGVADPFQTPTTVGERDSGGWLAPAAWVEASWKAHPRLRLVGGVRVDGDRGFGRPRAWVDPRLAAIFDARPGTVVSAAAGIYGSPPQPQEASRTFGNPDVEANRGLHLSLGVRQELPWASHFELTGYYKNLWSLIVPTRALDDQGHLLRYSNEGRGESIGVELLVRRELARGLFGWISYAISRSIRLDDPTVPPYPDWRLFALDQTHVLAVILSYRMTGDWILGTRVRAVSGDPTTPSDGHVLDANTGRSQCLAARQPYSARLPGFFQADARVDKRFVYDRWMFAAYVDVQNVSNRDNAEFRFPSFDCTETTSIPSIPLFPSIGLRAEW